MTSVYNLSDNTHFCLSAEAAVIGGVFLVNLRRLEKPKVDGVGSNTLYFAVLLPNCVHFKLPFERV